MIVSQAQGRFSVSNLPSGSYVAQAIGGDFQSEPSAPVDVADDKSATADLALTSARAAQLPGAWPGRLPGERVGEGGEGAAIPEQHVDKMVRFDPKTENLPSLPWPTPNRIRVELKSIRPIPIASGGREIFRAVWAMSSC